MNCGTVLTALALLLASPAVAADPPRVGTADLVCGAARLHARTASVAHVAPDDGLAWVSQEITLQGPSGVPSRLHVVDADKPPGTDVRGLPVIVSSWQCLSGSQGKVIELWLTCNRADLGGACKGEREWERLIDVTGRPLDVGYAPQDPRYNTLSRRLGIPADEVKLQDALGD